MAREIDAALSRYITAVHQYPKLTREEELKLTRQWVKTQDPKVADELVRAHMRYVVAIALKYRRYGVPLAELIAEGNFGVVHALKKFEPERGNRFVTYAAYWIRAYVLNYVIRSWSLVGVGSGALRSKLFFKLRRERVRVMNLLGDTERANEALAKKFNVTPEQVAAMVRRLETRDLSLDTKVFDDSATSMVDTLPASDASQDETLEADQRRGVVKRTVRTALETLDQRERYIVENRLLADSEDELSLAEIGRRLGVSRERARQLEERAKRKLRQRITEISRSAQDSREVFDSAAA
ncbi:MAG: RNA polymerase factor sigma-32 [Myxococcales bacterium]|nr:RNA polymerase factor sigma-32 [Myxococcales bacterium]MCB9577652.1 RNA polymerase factor sigma-32 [Polyangiaceae bacterium]